MASSKKSKKASTTKKAATAASKKKAAPVKKKAAAVKAEPTSVAAVETAPVEKAKTVPVKSVKKATDKKATAKKASPTSALVEADFSYYSPESSKVYLAGSFNGWALQEMKRDDDGTWTLHAELEKGEHQYKYVFDGVSWEIDPNAPTVTGEFGANNLISLN